MAACSRREQYEKLTSLASQDDSEAFNRALVGGASSGSCLILSQGAIVFLEDTAIFAGLVKVRPRGNPDGYWTAAENIRPR